jgi:hypothetical protein
LVDATDLIVITSVAQTVVITLTLAVFIFQFRSQEKSIREAAVQSVMGHYTDYIRMLVEKPELTKMLSLQITTPSGKPLERLSPEDEAIQAYLLLGYGMFEEIYALHKRGWMDDETWRQWSSFLQRMTAHPIFRRVHEFSAGTFDSDFQDYVSRLIEDSRKRSEGGPAA